MRHTPQTRRIFVGKPRLVARRRYRGLCSIARAADASLCAAKTYQLSGASVYKEGQVISAESLGRDRPAFEHEPGAPFGQ